ncbi:biofilm regulation diguanylate cyclase SiaD [Azovibrio restrictus]|uniref:biofilm regulation diguanylate cyclase SiaD n=1 Tax=Azovibrio restrictus TaxID=146938 RepID=UPI0026ECA583|nr:biofilm regulation diguanylate cyclase SiaD [Azovibrio restrictus]MDD3482865.1 biofilm regulation diguanylate cyclase SiaD [Azovibrio restrictus]
MNAPLLAPSEQELLRQVEALLAQERYQDHPLRDALARLFEYSEGQRERLERLIKISDGYHSISRSHSQTLTEQYDRQLRRLEKLARISDRYQNSLRELSEALKDAALRDPLTGLGNRRFLMERIKEETERANRKQAPYSLGILDVDHFKAINDQFGHETGDKVLCEIGLAIQDALREYDLCGRWGGEEFLIMLPETPVAFARQVAERVCLGIKEVRVNLHQEGCTPPISASLGLTQYRFGESFSEALNRADTALLQAKAAGRDRLEVA